MPDAVHTEQGPRPIGPYSKAVRGNGLIFVSGQTPIDPRTQRLVEGDVAAQTRRALENVSEILGAAGSGLGRIVRCGVFLKDLNDFAEMNRAYAEFFPSDPPARTTVEVSRLPLDARVEIDAIALDGEGGR